MGLHGPLLQKWTVLLVIGLSLDAATAVKEEEEAELLKVMDFLHRDFSKLHEDFYRDADPALGMEDNAKASVKHFCDSANLDDELSEDEKAKFEKRVIDELILELDNDGFSAASPEKKKQLWKEALKKALDDQKPCATEKMAETLMAVAEGSAKFEPWMADISCEDMKMLNGLVMSKKDEEEIDKVYDTKAHALIAETSDPDDMYPDPNDAESVKDQAASFMAVLEQGLDFLNGTLHGKQTQPSAMKESLLEEGESTEFNLTSVLDPRSKWPNCAEVIYHIRDQGRCGSCWAQAVASVAESRLCIKSNGKFTGKPGWISAGYIASCGNGGRDGCRGGNPGAAMGWQANNGVPTGGNGNTFDTCVPYFGTGNSLDHFNGGGRSPPCPSKCSTKGGRSFYGRQLHQDKFYGPPASYRTVSSMNDAKRAILQGPIPMGFKVFADFMQYRGGVYRPRTSRQQGMHATAAIGYGPDYILSQNSWGTRWGDKGLFKISQCCGMVFWVPNDFSLSKSAFPLPGGGAVTPTPTPKNTPSPSGGGGSGGGGGSLMGAIFKEHASEADVLKCTGGSSLLELGDVDLMDLDHSVYDSLNETSLLQLDETSVSKLEDGSSLLELEEDVTAARRRSTRRRSGSTRRRRGSTRRRRGSTRRRRKGSPTPAPKPPPAPAPKPPPPVPSPRPPPPAPSGPRPSDSNLAAVLDRHNKYRCMHGVQLLKWNNAIAAKAKQWAAQTRGQMKHSSSSFRQGVGGFSYLGENLAWGATGANAVDMWYNEIKLTPGGRGLVQSFSGGTGHYTQVVWKETSDLGCAVYQKLIVCMYGKGGNMGGQFTRNVNSPVKSSGQCPDGGGGGGGGGSTPTPTPRPTPPTPPAPSGGAGKRCILYFGHSG